MWHNLIAVWKEQVTCSLVSAATMPSEVASVGWPWGNWAPYSDYRHHFLDTLNLVRTQYLLCLPYLPSPPDPSLTSSFPHSTTWANVLIGQLSFHPNLFPKVAFQFLAFQWNILSFEDPASSVATSSWCSFISSSHMYLKFRKWGGNLPSAQTLFPHACSPSLCPIPDPVKYQSSCFKTLLLPVESSTIL